MFKYEKNGQENKSKVKRLIWITFACLIDLKQLKTIYMHPGPSPSFLANFFIVIA